LNWHWLPKDVFAADIRDLSDTPIDDEEIDEQYDEFLNDVEAVQMEQVQLLRAIIEQHGIRQVHVEGLTTEAMPGFRQRIESMRKFEQNKPEGNTPIEQLMLSEYRADLLEVGAIGRLLLSRELLEVFPADDAESLELANPIQGDTVQLDSAAIERRENAVVEKLRAGGTVIILIMGGGHDLSDNVPSDWEYLRVVTEQYRLHAD
jgi:hypothetical protein